MSRASHRGVIGLLLVPILLFAVGCPRQHTVTQEETNLSNLARLYGFYVGKNRGQPPADLATLEGFAQKADRAELQRRGVTATDLQAIFVSSRDNQPFVYRRPKGKGVPGVGGGNVILYEQTGSGGKR